jgi:hypothetical protein
MSDVATLPNDLGDELLQGLVAILDAPPESTPEFGVYEESRGPRKRKRFRQGENVKPTPLQMRYFRQLRDRRQNRPELLEAMSRMVAWTWMPGKDRKACPPVVDLRDPRLVVMDRFPAENSLQTQIGLAMYRATIAKPGIVTYGSPGNLEMFKDFSIRPHFRAGGLCLDSRNEDVFRTGLALDQAMEQVALGKLDPVTTFDPPQCLFGFPQHYVPHPEWRGPMQDAVLRALRPDGALLRCLQSPGGTVVGVTEAPGGFRLVNVEKDGNLIQVKVPVFAILSDVARNGGNTQQGEPLADLPRGEFAGIKDVTARYPFRSLEWLEQRIMEELTETISVEEEVYDRQTKARTLAMTTWRCVPSQFVQTQMGRAVRFFLDMRQHLGRKGWTIDSFERDVYSENPHQVRIDVRVFDERPTVQDLQFTDSLDLKSRTWDASLLATPTDAAWASRIRNHGRIAA